MACPRKACPVELTQTGKLRLVQLAVEERVHLVVGAVAGADTRVISAVRGHQGFVSFDLVAIGGVLGVAVAIRSDQRNPTSGLEDAAELGEGTVLVEPVEGATRGHKIDGCVGERGFLGSSVDDFELRRGPAKVLFHRGAHLVAHVQIRLDCEHAIAIR